MGSRGRSRERLGSREALWHLEMCKEWVHVNPGLLSSKPCLIRQMSASKSEHLRSARFVLDDQDAMKASLHAKMPLGLLFGQWPKPPSAWQQCWSLSHLGNKGLKTQKQCCRSESLVLSTDTWLLTSLPGLPRDCVLRNHCIKHRQLHISSLSDSCCFSQTGVIACPFCLMAYGCRGKILGIITQKCQATLASLCSLQREIIDKICMYQKRALSCLYKHIPTYS